MKRGIFLSLLLFFYTSISFALSSQQADVMKAGEQWSVALKARDAQKITDLYET